MIPLFVPEGASPPAHALAVDGAVPGASAIYSHWQGDHTTPEALAADTSTAMLVRAAADADRWLGPYGAACLNHIDADGLLSLLVACRPQWAAAHGPRLIAAAEAGDFTVWRGEDAHDLLLRLHQHIRSARSSGDGWEQRCAEALIGAAGPLLEGPWPGAAERAAAITQLRRSIDLISRKFQPISSNLSVVSWSRQYGHERDPWLTVYAVDDLPLAALSTVVPSGHFQLLLEHRPAGIVVNLDAPRHSWARTVSLPTVRWPDATAVAATLAAADPDAGWCARPQAASLGFTCVLGTQAPSRLPSDTIIDACSNLLSPPS